MPQISVIIPTYNSERDIDTCLDMLIAQSFPDFEILCIDDCSTENNLRIIEQYTKFDKRIKIVPNTSRYGPDFVRGIGIKNAQSPYCVFVDDDDYFSPFMLEKYLDNIKSTDSDYMYGASINFDNTTRYIQGHMLLAPDTFLNYMHGNTFNAENTPDFFPFYMNSEFWGKIFKTEFIKDITLVPNTIIQDISFCFKCFFKAQKISYLLEPLYVYNYRRKGSLSSMFNEKWLEIFLWIDEIKQTIKKAGVFEKYKNAYIDFKLSRIWFYLLNAQPESQRAFFEQAKATFVKENFSDYDFSVLQKNKFFQPTLFLLNTSFEDFRARYLGKGA